MGAIVGSLLFVGYGASIIMFLPDHAELEFASDSLSDFLWTLILVGDRDSRRARVGAPRGIRAPPIRVGARGGPDDFRRDRALRAHSRNDAGQHLAVHRSMRRDQAIR